jgi:hypothetical protein
VVYVVAGTYRQFDYWCTFRGWSPLDRGIRPLIREQDFYGIQFRPGDLVIELELAPGEIYNQAARNRAEAYRIVKLRASRAVSFRFETTLPPERDGSRRIIR